MEKAVSQTGWTWLLGAALLLRGAHHRARRGAVQPTSGGDSDVARRALGNFGPFGQAATRPAGQARGENKPR